MPRIFDLNGNDVNRGNLLEDSSMLVTGTAHKFTNFDQIVIDNNLYRITFPKLGAAADGFYLMPRDPATNVGGFAGDEWSSANRITCIVKPDGENELINAIQIVKNTLQEVCIVVWLASGNYYKLTIWQDWPGIKLDTYRRDRDGIANVHVVGLTGGRWTLLGDNTIAADKSITTLPSTTTGGTGTANYFAVATADKHHIIGITADYLWSSLVTSSTDVQLKDTAANTNQVHSHWVWLAPTFNMQSTGGNYFHATQSGGAKDATHTCNIGVTGYWRLAFCPTDVGGATDVSFYVHGAGSPNYTHGAAIAQNAYIVTPPIGISRNGGTLRVVVTNGGATASYVAMWLPVMPSSSTQNWGLFCFPGFVSQVHLAKLSQTEDIVN